MADGFFDQVAELPGLFGRVLKGAGGAYGRLMGGIDDPNMSPEENARARRQAMILSGAQLMQGSSGAPGVTPAFGPAFAQAVATGQQAGSAIRGQAYRQAKLQDIPGLDPRQQAILHALPPQFQAQMLSTLATMPPPEDVEIPSNLRGAMMLYGISPEMLDTLSPTQRKQLLEAMGVQRGATTINLNQGTQNQLADVALEEFRENREGMNAAYDRLRFLDQMERLLDEGTPTGPSQAFLRPLKRILADFGVLDPSEVEELNRQDVFRALENRFAIAMRQNMPGQMSDRDVRFLQEQVPRLTNLPGGNRKLIQYMRMLAERQIEIAELQRQYLAQNPDNPAGWFQYQQEWVENNPLFADEPIQVDAPNPLNRGR